MSKIVATFSNGFTDTYNGHRAVKAAWMLTRKDNGKVIASGHSMDAEKARKTAMGHARENARSFGEVNLHVVSRITPATATKHARQAGFPTAKAHRDAWNAEIDRALLNCHLEVIAL